MQRRFAAVRVVLLIATVMATCPGSARAASNDIEVDSDSSGAGGDGIAGQVIGSFTSGRSVVIATSSSRNATGEGGSVRTDSRVSIAPGSSDSDESADAIGGDGIAVQVAGVSSPSSTTEDVQHLPGPAPGEGSLPLLFEIAP